MSFSKRSILLQSVINTLTLTHLSGFPGTERDRRHLLAFWISSSLRRTSLCSARHQSWDTMLLRFWTQTSKSEWWKMNGLFIFSFTEGQKRYKWSRQPYLVGSLQCSHHVRDVFHHVQVVLQLLQVLVQSRRTQEHVAWNTCDVTIKVKSSLTLFTFSPLSQVKVVQ